MKLERVQEYVLPTVATLGGMGFAVLLGHLMGEGRFSMVALFFGGLFLAFTTLILRQYVWLLLIVAWPWSGQIPILPLPFMARDLAIGAVVAATLALMALKVVRRQPSYTLVDLVLAVLLFYMLTAWLRNPTGTLASNSFRVGGRPYFNTLVALGAYWVLCRSSLNLPGASRIYIFSTVLSNFAIAGLNIICEFSNRATRVVANFYTGIAAAADLEGTSQGPGPDVSRYGYLIGIGAPISQALISFRRPLEVINPLYFWRLFLLIFAIFMLLLSGFRTTIISLGALMLIRGYLSGGLFEVVKLSIIGTLALSIVVIGNGRLYNLPLSAQRALCFLPGKWSPIAKADAEASTDWRLQMWAVMLSSNRYIQNRVFGDGFGVTKRDMDTISRLTTHAADAQESTMITGGVHSGPLSTIRVAGYVGLVIFLILTFQIASLAVRLIRRAEGTSLEPMAFFIGLPLIYEPFNFIFIFGGFDASLPQTVFSLGLLKMLENTINDHQPAEVPVESARPNLPVHRRQVSRPEPVLALRAPR